MTRSKEILNELTSISSFLSQAPAEMPYAVPEGYFDTLDSVIRARIAAGGNEEQSFLLTEQKQMPQDVPQGYFEGLADVVLSKIKSAEQVSSSEEINQLSPVLAGLQKTNPYQVPEGYFDVVTNEILDKTTGQKVVPMFNKKIWSRFAVAATFLLFVGFGLKYFIPQKSAIVPVAKSEEQIKNELAQISDEEIINYLKMTSDAKDAETIASYVDQSQLPAESEYLDNNFLDTYMKELEKTEKIN